MKEVLPLDPTDMDLEDIDPDDWESLASSLKDNPDTMPIGTTEGRTEALGEYHLSSGSDMHCVVGDSTGGFSGEEDDEMIVLENLNIRSIESNLTPREKGTNVQCIRIRGSVDRGISLHVGCDQNIVLNIEPAAAICKPKKRAKKRDTYTCSKCGASPKKGHKCPFNNAKLPAIAERYKAKAKELIVLARRFEKTAQKADLKDKARKEA